MFSSGQLGWVNESCNVGDKIMLLEGVPVPVAFTKLSDGTYLNRGDVHVHGEAWSTSDTICIRIIQDFHLDHVTSPLLLSSAEQLLQAG